MDKKSTVVNKLQYLICLVIRPLLHTRTCSLPFLMWIYTTGLSSGEWAFTYPFCFLCLFLWRGTRVEGGMLKWMATSKKEVAWPRKSGKTLVVNLFKWPGTDRPAQQLAPVRMQLHGQLAERAVSVSHVKEVTSWANSLWKLLGILTIFRGK